MSSALPGIVARHAVITPQCRASHGVEEAFEAAVERLREEYLELQLAANEEADFHVLLTVQRPERAEGGAAGDPA